MTLIEYGLFLIFVAMGVYILSRIDKSEDKEKRGR